MHSMGSVRQPHLTAAGDSRRTPLWRVPLRCQSQAGVLQPWRPAHPAARRQVIASRSPRVPGSVQLDVNVTAQRVSRATGGPITTIGGSRRVRTHLELQFRLHTPIGVGGISAWFISARCASIEMRGLGTVYGAAGQTGGVISADARHAAGTPALQFPCDGSLWHYTVRACVRACECVDGLPSSLCIPTAAASAPPSQANVLHCSVVSCGHRQQHGCTGRNETSFGAARATQAGRKRRCSETARRAHQRVGLMLPWRARTRWYGLGWGWGGCRLSGGA